MVKKKAEKTFGTKQFDTDLMKLKDMILVEDDALMYEHIDNQIKTYQDVKEEKAAEEKKKKAQAAKAKAEAAIKSEKVNC